MSYPVNPLPPGTPTVRLWGAVMTDDGPVAEVRDIEATDIGTLLDDQEFRSWHIASLRWPPSGEGHTRGKACVPGKPCAKCMAHAQSWWWEHARRTRQRRWMATTLHARDRIDGGWAARDYGEARDTREAAEADARLLGWPLVREGNGHGKTIAWHEVGSATDEVRDA